MIQTARLGEELVIVKSVFEGSGGRIVADVETMSDWRTPFTVWTHGGPVPSKSITIDVHLLKSPDDGKCNCEFNRGGTIVCQSCRDYLIRKYPDIFPY